MTTFKHFRGNWIELRSYNPREIDLHFGEREAGVNYWDVMAEVEELVRQSIAKAQDDGVEYVLFRHGCSTSLGWQQTTARSVVRGFMRSPEATPFIIRKECWQHESVFLARIRQQSVSQANSGTLQN